MARRVDLSTRVPLPRRWWVAALLGALLAVSSGAIGCGDDTHAEDHVGGTDASDAGGDVTGDASDGVDDDSFAADSSGDGVSDGTPGDAAADLEPDADVRELPPSSRTLVDYPLMYGMATDERVDNVSIFGALDPGQINEPAKTGREVLAAAPTWPAPLIRVYGERANPDGALLFVRIGALDDAPFEAGVWVGVEPEAGLDDVQVSITGMRADTGPTGPEVGLALEDDPSATTEQQVPTAPSGTVEWHRFSVAGDGLIGPAMLLVQVDVQAEDVWVHAPSVRQPPDEMKSGARSAPTTAELRPATPLERAARRARPYVPTPDTRWLDRLPSPTRLRP